MNTSEPNSLKWEDEFRQKWEGANTGGHNAISTPIMDEIISDIANLLSQQKEEFKKMCGEVEVLEYPNKIKISCEKAYTYGQMNMLLRIINKI